MLLIIERLVNNQLALARPARPLDDNECVGSLHKPCLNLFNVFFPIIPDSLHAHLFLVFAMPRNEVACISLDPLIDLVFLDVQGPRDMRLDEEGSDPDTTVSNSSLASFIGVSNAYGSKTATVMPAIIAATIGITILG